MKNRKTKLLVLLLALVLAFTLCTLALAACHNKPDGSDPKPSEPGSPVDPSPAPHVHSFSLASQVAATCTETGSQVYSCSCGESYTIVLDALGHDLQPAGDNEAHWQACTRCSYQTEHTAHVYSTVVSVERAATCTQEGSQTVRCECGAQTTQGIPTVAHSYTLANKDSVHHWVECSVCHTVDSSTLKEHVFSMQLSIDPATCTRPGSREMQCSCGATHTYVIEQTDHTYTLPNKDGTHHWMECAECHTVDQSTKVEHAYTTQVSQEPSTCTEQGHKVMQCSCGATNTETLQLAPHVYTLYGRDEHQHWKMCVNCSAEQAGTRTEHVMVEQPVTEPTCTRDGLESKLCVCGLHQDNVVTPALGHSWNTEEFSKTTAEGHFRKCTRCGEEKLYQHSFEDCACPYGKAKSATCGEDGHSDVQCTECGLVIETVIPATGEHTPADGYHNNETHHWKLCSVCGTRLDEEQHGSWQDVVISKPTCTDDGYVDKRCTACGFSIREVLHSDGHQWGGEWLNDEQCHWLKCTVCGTEQSSHADHSFTIEHSQEPSCTQDGFNDEVCSACGYSKHTVLPKGAHNFQPDESGRVPSTCTEPGHHDEVCSNCGQRQTVTDELAPHKTEYFPAKERTDSEDGWKRHWKCTVCGKYFLDDNCQNEVTEEQVFDRAPGVVSVETLEELAQIAEESHSKQQSSNYYQVKAPVVVLDRVQWFLDDGNTYVYVHLKSAVSGVEDDDIVTVRGFLKADVSDGSETVVHLNEAVLVDVEKPGSEPDTDIASLTVAATVNAGKPTLYATSETGGYFLLVNYGTVEQSYFVDELLVGEQLTFFFADYGDKNGVTSVVSRLVINGKSYTMENGQLTITVEGDVRAEFTFAQYATNIVKLSAIDTSVSGKDVAVDPYLTYKYVGGANEYGRLYANSQWQLYFTNAYITRIEIELEDYQTDKLHTNVVYIGTDADHKHTQSFELSGLKLTMVMDASLRTSYWQFNAVVQTHVKSVTIQYCTYNT